MDSGDIYVFDLDARTFCQYKIEYCKLFPNNQPATVLDMKCHLTKMHRLLISYGGVAVVVFSLNKNRIIQQITIDTKMQQEKGDALAVEWMSPECNEFFVGFAKGGINMFKAETNSQKPSRILKFEEGPLNSMELAFF